MTIVFQQEFPIDTMQQETKKEITSIRDITVDEKFQKILTLNLIFSGIGIASIIAIGSFLLS